MSQDLKNFYQALDDRVLDLSDPADARVYVKDLHRHGHAADTLEVLGDRIVWDTGG